MNAQSAYEIYDRARENHVVAEYAREFVVATQEYEDDRYSPGWTERATRAHLARAALWGACGFVEQFAFGEKKP